MVARRAVRSIMVLLSPILPAALLRPQGFPPEEALRRMTVPAGIEVRLFASEPMVRQPVAIEFDDRGRLWAIQYLQYPNPAGLERVQVDRYSRTAYDRVPEPPPRGPKGADRVTILEDQDGDGRADQAKDFVSGLNLASGLAFGDGGVYILQAPYLLFYPDRDRDDAPDGDPEILLSGFGMEDASAVANSLIWGPDGWLYGAQGSTVTANLRDLTFQQGVWRYHPRTRRFELFYEGGGNTWGLDFDAQGNLFASTNVGGYVMLHGVQGGYYWKQFEKHGGLNNPHAFGWLEHAAYRDFRGGHVAAGGIIYEGDGLPPAFRGKYLAANVLSHAVYWHDLELLGSTFQARHGGELLEANDTWSAPCDLAAGPDGAVYVADWYDQRTAHPDPDAEWDRSNGRIYRIARKGARPAAPLDMAALPSGALADLLEHPNAWRAGRALKLLADRRDRAALSELERRLEAEKDEAPALRALWAVHGLGGLDEPLATKLLDHPSAGVRAWTVRLLGDGGEVSASIAGRFLELARSDPSPRVRSQLASTCRRLGGRSALPVAWELCRRAEDREDSQIPLLLWWAVENQAISDRERALALFARREAWEAPLALDAVLERLVRRYAAEGGEAGLGACARLLATAPAAPERQRLFKALEEGLLGRRLACVPPELERIYLSWWREKAADPARLRLGARLGIAACLERLEALARDRGLEEAERAALLAILGELARPQDLTVLLEALEREASGALRSAALKALASFDDSRAAGAILKSYRKLSEPLRHEARALLFSRRVSALEFLKRVEGGEVDAAEVPVAELQQLAVFGDGEIEALVRRRWGSIQRATAEEKLAEVRRLSNDLRAGKGDPARGRELFQKHCGICHRLFGEGQAVGPDLTSANRGDAQVLLVNLVDPSAVIRREFLSYAATLRDGRVVAGLIVEEAPAALTFAGANGERFTVERRNIRRLEESSVSLMPERLLNAVSPPELRDLFSYLQSEEPGR